MKLSKVCNTIAAVVGYGTLAVAAYTVIDALILTIQQEYDRRHEAEMGPINMYFDKNMTMGEWLNRNEDENNV